MQEEQSRQDVQEISAPDYLGTLMGVRAWSHGGGGYLHSPIYMNAWEGVQDARKHFHYMHLDAPEAGCNCGLHAYYTHSDYKWNSIFGYRDDVVVGVVSAWGKVVLHRDGFRARYMKVEAIIAGRKPEEEKLIAMMHNVPILKPKEVQKFCEERGVVEPLGRQGFRWSPRHTVLLIDAIAILINVYAVVVRVVQGNVGWGTLINLAALLILIPLTIYTCRGRF